MPATALDDRRMTAGYRRMPFWGGRQLAIAGLLAGLFGSAAEHLPVWKLESTKTDASLRGLSVLKGGIIWASGTAGTLLRSADGGRTWARSVLDESMAKLDFRDVEAFDAQNAIAMSSGPGALSNVYRTDDGGVHWRLVFANPDREGFFDAVKFWDPQHGVLIGDAVRGRFAVFTTRDGGLTWKGVPGPEALPGESLFAASGTSLVLATKPGEAWIGTGGASIARVLRCIKGMTSCEVSDTPLRAGAPSAGIFSIAACNSSTVIAVGGDYSDPTGTRGSGAYSNDGGKHWTASAGLTGYRSAVQFLTDHDCAHAIAVGTNGSDITQDGGAHWRHFSNENFSVLARVGEVLWAAGPHGRAARLIR